MLLADLRSAPALTLFALVGITASLWMAYRLIDWAWRLAQSPDARMGRLQLASGSEVRHASSCCCRTCIVERYHAYCEDRDAVRLRNNHPSSCSCPVCVGTRRSVANADTDVAIAVTCRAGLRGCRGQCHASSAQIAVL